MRPLDQEVALELSDMVDDARHATRGTGQVDAAKGEAVNPDAKLGQLGDCAGDVDGVAPEAVQLGDDEDIVLLQPVHQLLKFRAARNS